jgi:hypothetical protein
MIRHLARMAAVWLIPVVFLPVSLLAGDDWPAHRDTTGSRVLNTPAHYGVVYVAPSGPWSEADLQAADVALGRVRSLGVDTIIQTFAVDDGSGAAARGWLAFLDLAGAHGVRVVAYPWPNRVYGGPGVPFNLTDIEAFLAVAAAHPALIGIVVLHEPLEPQLGIRDVDLRRLYTAIKSVAPDIMVAHYMNNIWRAEALRPDGWRFSDDMCDICIIWTYPSVYEAGEPVIHIEDVTEVVGNDLALLRERDPDAELWFLGQAFEQRAYRTPLRFPTPEEMRDIYEAANEYAIDGLLWYAWEQSEIYDAVLGDDDRQAHQAMVKTLAMTRTNRHQVLLPLAMRLSRPDGLGRIRAR